MENLKVSTALVGAYLAFSLLYVLPNFVELPEGWLFTKEKIIYGLDIQGGSHLVMGVDVAGVMKERTERMARTIQADLIDKGVPVKVNLSEEGREITVEATSEGDRTKILDYISEVYGATLQIVGSEGAIVRLKFFEARALEYAKQVVDQSIEVIRNRIDEFGVSEPVIAAQGQDRILIQLPGVKDSARAKELINRTAKMDFRIVSDKLDGEALAKLISEAETAGKYALGQDELGYAEYVKRLNEDLKGKIPEGTSVAFEKAPSAVTLEAGKIPYLLEGSSGLTGDLLEDAYVAPGEYGAPEVLFRFNSEGRRKFAELTGAHVNRQMAIVLDEVVQSAPNIQGRIDSNQARITLGRSNYEETLREANFIATALRAGALPAALEQLEERTVGPTLGADSIERGKVAGLVGICIVVLFMLAYYKGMGVFSAIALVINVLSLLAILSALGATLTLPGVAGIVLTVGMAVDANVIIFERIKEELAKGASVVAAVRDGFGHAFSAIFDSNITTAMAGVLLIYFGTGPVRGFGVTLLAGIATSMITAVFVTRVLTEWYLKLFRVQKLSI